MPRELIARPISEIDRPWPQQNRPLAARPYENAEFTAAPGDAVSLGAPLWRRKKTIAAVAGLGLILGGVVTMLMPPVYRARTAIQLEGFNNDQVTPIAASLPNASAENYLQNQVKVLESDTLAKRVADVLYGGSAAASPVKTSFLGGLKDRLFPPSQMSEEERRVNSVKSDLTIRTSLQSQVVELFFDSKDRQKAAMGANAARNAFVDLNREAREQLVLDTTDWLNKQAADLKASIERANQHLQGFAQSSGLVLAGNEGTVAQERTRETEEALARAEADRAAKQSRFETASAAGSSDLFADALATGPFHQYQIDLGNMRRELAQLKTLYTPANYKVERLQAQIAETERAMEEERKATVARMGNEYTAASRLESLLADAHARQLKTAEQEMANDRQYNMLKSEIDTTQKLYETVLEKAKEAGATSALRATNVRLIDAAAVPSTPYSPKPLLNMAIGFALGSLGGVGLVLATERSDKVRQPGEIRVLNVPELGVIPSAKHANALDYQPAGLAKNRSGEVGLVARDRSTSILTESFRGALTSILFGGSYQPEAQLHGLRPSGRVLVVTSVDMMEGKTTILTNLGVVAAERAQRVLLVDADLRRPRLHNIFNVPNDRGLTDVLLRSQAPDAADNLPLDSMIRPTAMAGLSVLPSGPVDAASTTLLHSSDFHAFLQRCRKDFDLVLIDTPPLMLYADSRILGRMSDGVVLVVRANTRSQDELKIVCDRLHQDQIPVLGTILNDWKMDPAQARSYSRYRDHYQRPA